MNSLEPSNPKEHAQYIEQYITELKNLCHEETKLVTDPKARALFETTAEVLNGLEKAYSDFQSENYGAWVNDLDRPNLD